MHLFPKSKSPQNIFTIFIDNYCRSLYLGFMITKLKVGEYEMDLISTKILPDGVIVLKSKEDMGPTLVNRKPTIDSKLLVNLSKSGRSVLAYLIDNVMDMHEKNQIGYQAIIIDKLDISNYIATHIGKKEANTWNVERGLKDLMVNRVLSYPVAFKEGHYNLNLKLLSR